MAYATGRDIIVDRRADSARFGHLRLRGSACPSTCTDAFCGSTWKFLETSQTWASTSPSRRSISSICLVGAFFSAPWSASLPGIGPVTTIAMLLAFHLQDAGGSFADHAGRHLLRGASRRFDDGDHAEHAGANHPPSSSVSTAILWQSRDAPGSRSSSRPLGHSFAGCVGVVIIATLAPFLYSESSLLIGPPEYAIHDHHGPGQLRHRRVEITADDDRDVGRLGSSSARSVRTSAPARGVFTFGSHYLADGVSFVGRRKPAFFRLRRSA